MEENQDIMVEDMRPIQERIAQLQRRKTKLNELIQDNATRRLHEIIDEQLKSLGA